MLDLGNRRTSHRVRDNLLVEFYGDDFEVLQGQTIDISSGGARLLSNGIPRGNHFHVSIYINGHRLTALADKAWQAKENSNGSAVVGFKFSQMNHRDRRALHDYCGRKAQQQNEKKLPRKIKLPNDRYSANLRAV